MASLENLKVLGPFRVQDGVPRDQNLNFRKMKKTPPEIHQSYKCAKFQTDLTSYGFTRSIQGPRPSPKGPKSKLSKNEKNTPGIHQSCKCAKFQTDLTSYGFTRSIQGPGLSAIGPKSKFSKNEKITLRDSPKLKVCQISDIFYHLHLPQRCFSQIWNLCKNMAIDINFHYKFRKKLRSNFSINSKKTFLDQFPLFLRQNVFAKKSGYHAHHLMSP